jgi:dihydroorotate dehydrogenase (fumarate)
MEMKTQYMGMELSSPIVAGAGPLSRNVDNVRKLAEAGAGAVVLWSLFEEQIEHEADELDFFLQYGTDRFAESLTYYPAEPDYVLGPQKYLDHIKACKDAVEIPIIASLNGFSTGGWVEYAAKMAEAGADAVELNPYWIPTNPDQDAEQVEQVYLNVLKAVRNEVDAGVAVKLSPYFSATANMARRLEEGGADALVLFNRFYQPDLDIEELEVVPRLTLSTGFEMRLPLRWIAILFGKLEASLAASTGVQTGTDVAKLILAGADVVQVCSALLRNGPEYMRQLNDDLQRVMESREYESVDQMRGVLSQARCPEPAAFERANYMKTLNSYGRTATFE